MERLDRSVIALTGARLVSVAAVFVAGVVAARLLTPAQMGVAGVGLTVGWAVAIFANGGLNISAIYFLGQRPHQRVALVGRVLGLGLGSAVAAVTVTALAAPVVAGTVLDGAYPGLFVAAAAMAVGTIGYELTGAVLLGLQRRGPYVVADILRSAGTLGSTVVVLALLVRSPEGYVAATAVGVAVPAVYALSVVRRRVGAIRPTYDHEFAREAVPMGLRGQVGNVLTFFESRLDQLLVPAFVGLHAGGVYFIAARIAEVVGQPATATAAMLFPRVAESSKAVTTASTGTPGSPTGTTERVPTGTTERAARWTLLVTVGAAIGLGVVSPLVLGWVFGPAYLSGTTTLLILLVAMIPLSLSRVLAADLKGRGRPGMVSIGTGAGVVLVLALDLVLIPAYGMEGAAIAAALAQLATAAVLLRCYRSVTSGSLGALLPRPSDLTALISRLRNRVSA